MGLTRLSITRPLSVLMGILALVLLGGVSYGYLKIDRLPPLNSPIVNVSVNWPQAAAQDVEQLITKPLEDAVAGVAGIASISSTSSEGQSNVRIQFVDDADPNLTALDVERRVSAIRNRLPVDAGVPSVRKADPNAFPIMNVALTGAPLDQLYDIAILQIQPAVQSVLGVANVNVSGGIEREIQVKVDYQRLAAYNLTVTQVSTALVAANAGSTVGSAERGTQLLDIRTTGRFQSPAALGDVVIAQLPAGPVLLRDVATVAEGYKPRRQLQRICQPGQGCQDAVGISIVKDGNANALQVADDVRELLFEPRVVSGATQPALADLLPAGASILVRNDTSVYTRASLHAVQFDLILAILLVGFVTLLFLHAWKNVVIILLSIPTSMISTFLFMYIAGFTLNMMTLMALALMVGILVDSSIVVIENIHRHLQQGEPAKEAALHGRAEIGLATMAIAAADIVVYVPIAFMSGQVGQLFRQYGLTVVAATIFSLFISFTLTPMLASRWLAHDHESSSPLARFGRWWDARFDRVAALLESLVPRAVEARWLVLAASLALVVVAASLIQFRMIGQEYVPAEDDSNFFVNMRTPPGTTLDAADRSARQLEQALDGIPEVVAVFSTVFGAGAGVGGGNSGANITVQLVPKTERNRSVFEVINEIRGMGRQIPNVTVGANVASPLPGGGGSNININVIGPDVDAVTQGANQVQAVAADVPGLVDVQNQAVAGRPELRIVLDNVRLAQMNVTAQQVTDALRTTLGGRVVTVLRPGGRPQQDITLVASDADRTDLNNLASIPIRGGALQGQTVPVVTLGQVATLGSGTGPFEINRIDRNRTMEVRGTVSGRPLGDTAADLRAAVNSVALPPGYSVQLRGSVNQLNNALAALGQAMVLAVILEYMLLVALYQSWFYPLVLMFSVPLGLVGSMFALFITGNTINIFSLIGLIMGFGLVAKNGILLVDFTNMLREQGLERTQALAQAVRIRLRPILMTSATMVFGMFPLALKLESGAESRAPMAVVVIGAIIMATLLAVVVIPAVYTMFDDLQGMLARKPARVREPARAPARAPMPIPVPAMPLGAAANGASGNGRHEPEREAPRPPAGSPEPSPA
jgi:hydrophobic/amphiphilic exporter-1 (mainly G- bacteria), HAE1 family